MWIHQALDSYPHRQITMEPLISAIRKAAPAAIHDFNVNKLPHLEAFFGRSIVEEFPDPKQRTSETTKVVVRGLDNAFFRSIHALEPSFVEDEGAGRDNLYGDIPIEQKTTFGKGNTWTGNGYDKTGWHLLKKFSVDETGRINACFLALVNLNDCVSKWSDRTLKSNFSSLPLKTADKDKIHLIIGDLKVSKVNLTPVLVPVASLHN